MPINLKNAEAPIREARLGSITGYQGRAGDLCRRSRDGALKDRQRSFSQCATCASVTAICQLAMIQDAAVVNHAPLGCAGDFPNFNFINRTGQDKRGWRLANARLISSNLREDDMVFGGAARLKEAVREAYDRYRPRAIFVTTSCASGIMGEDIQGIADNIEDCLKEVDWGKIEAAQAMGSTPWEIIGKVLVPEALPSLVRGITLAVITITGFTATAGAVGAGGLGSLAIRYGYMRYRADIMIATVVILIVLVQGVQLGGDLIARGIDKRRHQFG